MSDNIIRFKRDTSFRNELFTPESFAHPAKLDSQLLIWIVEKYTQLGETILDPMFGSGTVMLACTLGRNVIGVELEQKFVDMAKANWAKVRQRPQLGSMMGTCQIIQGDARNLGGLLADKIVTSPPYADAQVLPHTAEGESRRLKIAKERGVSPDKVSYLDYTKADKIITSPPFTGTVAWQDPAFQDKLKEKYGQQRWSSDGQGQDDKNNIANLPYGSIDSVVTSPPYEEQMGEKHHSPRADKLAQEKANPTTYTDKVDHIVTSPPYEAAVTGQNGIDWSKGTRGQAEGNRPRDRSKEPAFNHLSIGGAGFNYSEAKENIGNLKSSSYLEAMSQVYSECFKVLKPSGLMILITKNFIREQKEIRLDLDTIRLCEQSGFTFKERWCRELPAQSFWRILYKKKFPDAPELKFEDVLVFKKQELARLERREG